MIEQVATQSLSAAAMNRRKHERVVGPFDGVRLGALETALRIFDLSAGGCFVNAMHEQTAGSRFALNIELPDVNMITLNAETLEGRSGCGFAVRFVDMDEETAIRLERALEHLQARAPRPERQAPRTCHPSILPLSAPLWEPSAGLSAPDTRVEGRPERTTVADRPRAERVEMLGSGYRARIDGRYTALINLSLTGAQVRGPIPLVPNQPVVIDFGWPQDEQPCSAIARVRWAQPESDSGSPEPVYRIGVTFETWDVRRLKEIMRHAGRTSVPTSAADPW